jgi:IS30 family transposase
MKEDRKYEHLSYEERSTIALGLQQGMSVRAIARALGRSPSTISRESRRNAPAAPYNCKFAQQRYQRRRRYSRPQPKLAPESILFEQVCRLLRRLWSPEQIAGHLATVHGTDQSQRVSHETIYTCIYAQPKGELRRELIACLRMARAKRWPRSRGTDRRGEIADLLSIHVRPPQINERQFPGHWEGDLIKGAGNLSAVGTLVERSSRFDPRFAAKVVLATVLLAALAGVAGSQIAPQVPLVEVLLYSALGAAALLGVLVVATIAKLALGQFILRKGGTDVQWFWFSGEPPGLEALRKQDAARRDEKNR